MSEFFTRVNTIESFVQLIMEQKRMFSVFGLIDQMLIKSPLIVTTDVVLLTIGRLNIM